jgi:hypothetical protein
MTTHISSIFAVLLLACTLCAQDRNSMLPQTKPDPKQNVNAAADDISGMYSFLGEGEFVQITLESDGVSGYISRRGDLESDHGAFLDHFFEKASVKNHDVTFTTKAVHGVWFEFTGLYDRGSVKTKDQDGYFVIRGTLKQFTTGSDGKVASRSRQVEFKLLAQPPDEEDAPRKKPANTKNKNKNDNKN